MFFKQVFVLFGTVCSLSLIALEVSAQQVNCSRFIYSGSKLSHVHNSPSGTFRGSIKIKSVYSCGNATCFDGTLDGASIEGEYSRKNLQFERSIEGSNIEGGYALQIWTGMCGSKIQGTWRDKPGTGSDYSGNFTIRRN
jgi:hypothetical protein